MANFSPAGKKLIGLDLDGTLTQHKTPLGEANRKALERLAARYRLLMVGAGACRRIYDQLGHFPIEIIGNYGLEHSVVRDGRFEVVENQVVPADRERIEKLVAGLRKKLHLESFTGNSVEFHASGAVTFPLLGTAAAAWINGKAGEAAQTAPCVSPTSRS